LPSIRSEFELPEQGRQLNADPSQVLGEGLHHGLVVTHQKGPWRLRMPGPGATGSSCAGVASCRDSGWQRRCAGTRPEFFKEPGGAGLCWLIIRLPRASGAQTALVRHARSGQVDSK
jgi:hypothetical protein